VTATADGQPRCHRCHRTLNRKQAVATRVGVFCPRHADRLAPHLRKPTRPRKAAAS